MQKIDKALEVILPLAVCVLLLWLWQVLSDHDIIRQALFSSPRDIFSTFLEEYQMLLQHVWASLYRLFVSVMIGYCLGICVGLLVCEVKFFSIIEDIATFFMSIPGIAWAPLFVITIGFGDITIISVGIITAFFPAVFYVVFGMKSIDKNLINVAKILEISGWKSIIHVKIPAIMNYLIVALALSFSKTWRTVIAVEMVSATMHGLGYMVIDAREFLNSSRMFLGIFSSGLLYCLLEFIFIRTTERYTVIKWGMKHKL